MNFERKMVPTKLGEESHHAGKLPPPEGWRWETDAEFRARILAAISERSESLDDRR